MLPEYYSCIVERCLPKKSWRICFGNTESKSTMAAKNRKSYLENRKRYEFLNAIFVLESLDQNQPWLPKIEKAISRTVRATNF